MLISEVKRYIKRQKAVSITDLTIKFESDPETLEVPLKILIDKGIIKQELLNNNESGNSKCKGCPMTCKPKVMEQCSSSEPFKIYVWNGD